MKIFRITAGLMTLAALSGPACASASSGSCSDGLTTTVQFESALAYDDMNSKSNPAVHVRGQAFALLADSALAQDGFSGILSPQAVAGLDAAVIDFDRNCFFTSPPFDVSSHEHLHVARGTTIRNSHDVMAVLADLDGQIIPLETDEEGVPNFGYIGMDSLKDRVVYYDGTRREFNLLTRLKFDKSLGQMH